MKRKAPKWITTFCASLLLVQLVAVPVSATSPVFDKDNGIYPILPDIKGDESPTPPTNNGGQGNGGNNNGENNNNGGSNNNGQEENKPPINWDESIEKNPIFDEEGVKNGKFTEYSWSPTIPTNYNKHLAEAKSSYANFLKTKSDEDALKAAYIIARLPLNAEIGMMRLKTEMLKDLFAEVDKLKNKHLSIKVYKIVGITSFEWIELHQYADDYTILLYVVKNMPKSPEKDKMQDLLIKAEDIMPDFDIENKPGQLPGTGDGDEDFEDGETIDNDYVGGVKPPSKPPVPTLPEKDFDRSKTSYSQKNGACYVTTKYYKNGKLIRTENAKATGSDLASCMTMSETPHKNPDDVKFSGYNPYDSNDRKALRDKLKAEEKEKSDVILGDLTIQYTFDKNDESPYYYDTGIQIAKSKAVTFEQARNALHIISVKAKGQFVEDSNQVLALVDGQVIRIESYEKEVAFAEFEKNFELTNVGVKVQDTRSETKQEIIDLIEIKGVQSIVVKDKVLELDAKPIIDNNIVLFPAEQLVKEIGGKISENVENKTWNVSINGQEIVYTIDKNTAILNGEEIGLTVPVRYNNEQKLMIPITTLLKQAKLDIVVENDKIIIQSIK